MPRQLWAPASSINISTTLRMVFAKKLLLQNKQNEDKTLGQMREEAEGSQDLWILAQGAQTGECCLPGILLSSAESLPVLRAPYLARSCCVGMPFTQHMEQASRAECWFSLGCETAFQKGAVVRRGAPPSDQVWAAANWETAPEKWLLAPAVLRFYKSEVKWQAHLRRLHSRYTASLHCCWTVSTWTESEHFPWHLPLWFGCIWMEEKRLLYNHLFSVLAHRYTCTCDFVCASSEEIPHVFFYPFHVAPYSCSTPTRSATLLTSGNFFSWSSQVATQGIFFMPSAALNSKEKTICSDQWGINAFLGHDCACQCDDNQLFLEEFTD